MHIKIAFEPCGFNHKHHRKYFQTLRKKLRYRRRSSGQFHFHSQTIQAECSCMILIIDQKSYHGFLLCSPVIGLDLESLSHSRKKVQFFETRLRIFFLALTWRDEIEIIIWPFSYFEMRTRLHIATLMFRDHIETAENQFSGRARKNEADSRREFPGSRILADLCLVFEILSKKYLIFYQGW